MTRNKAVFERIRASIVRFRIHNYARKRLQNEESASTDIIWLRTLWQGTQGDSMNGDAAQFGVSIRPPGASPSFVTTFPGLRPGLLSSRPSGTKPVACKASAAEGTSSRRFLLFEAEGEWG